jgi:hypothetical protein
MRYLKPIILAATVIAVSAICQSVASAQECSRVAIFKTDGVTAFTTVDISGGAVSTAAFDVSGFKYVVVEADIVDADNGVSNMRLTMTESQTSGGTFRTVPDCEKSATALACESLKIDWDPSADGKSYVLAIPVRYQWLKMTQTPTGHGASDTLTLGLRGCY